MKKQRDKENVTPISEIKNYKPEDYLGKRNTIEYFSYVEKGFIFRILRKIFFIFTAKRIGYIQFVLNISSILFGLNHLFFPNIIPNFDIYGVVYLITLFGNYFLIYVNLNYYNLSEFNQKLVKLRRLGSFYLFSSFLGIIIMALGHFISNNIAYIPFFGTLMLGTYIALLNIKYGQNEIHSSQIKKYFNRIYKPFYFSKFFCYSVLLLGLIFSYYVLFGNDYWYDISQFALFLSLIFCNTIIILLNLKDKQKKPRDYYGVAILGLILTGIYIVPYCLTSYNISEAESSFTETFGLKWQNEIPLEVEQYFLKTPFSTLNYFLGINSNNYIVEEDVLYYNGSNSNFEVDRNLLLYFDVYMPSSNTKDLPGRNSTLIRFHGGSFISGDKGDQNMKQMNYYFAKQGYIVFDIQYGLYYQGTSDMPLTPEYVRADFSMNDISRMIGIFLQYLEKNSEKYGANLDSVFISGHSAGGHLACLTGFAIASRNYTEIFGSRVIVKGIIPFYPGNPEYLNPRLLDPDLFKKREVYPEFLYPELMIGRNSSACLIFQGLGDLQVPPQGSYSIKNNYLNVGNNNCAVISFATAAHISDLHFTGYFNQIFLYYMERFMYLHR